MATYEIKYFLTQLNDELSKKFPDEQFLYEELDGIMQGLINSVRWSALRFAQTRVEDGYLFKVESVETADHFCSEWMGREEIVDRIENTSGLPTDIASYALSLIEITIDNVVFHEKTPEALEIENLGTIQPGRNKEYIIDLGRELRVSPGIGLDGGLSAFSA